MPHILGLVGQNRTDIFLFVRLPDQRARCNTENTEPGPSDAYRWRSDVIVESSKPTSHGVPPRLCRDVPSAQSRRRAVPPDSGSGLGQPSLGGISKRGNTYLRQLLIQGAQSSFLYLKRDQSALGMWLREVERRRHRQVAVVALANKMVRICWKVLTSEEAYEPYPASVV